MKFLKVVKELQSKEENKEKIIIVKCGAFFVSIGKDAIILNKLFNLKLTCIKDSVNFFREIFIKIFHPSKLLYK